MTPANDNNQQSRPAAFDAAVMQWVPLLRMLAARLESSAQDRDDLVQETIMIALHRWASFKPGNKISGWLTFQMRERCHEMRSKRAKLVTTSLDREITKPVAPSQEHEVELAQVMDAIKPKYKGVMTRLAAGYTMSEIGEIEGVTSQAIHERIKVCRASLNRMAA